MIIFKKLIKNVVNNNNSGNTFLFSVFSQYSYVKKGGLKVSENKSLYTVRQNRFRRPSQPNYSRIKLVKETTDDAFPSKKDKKIIVENSVNCIDDTLFFSLNADKIEKDVLKRVKKNEYLVSSNLFELDVQDQAKLITSCQRKLNRNEYLLLLLDEINYQNYKSELEYEYFRLEIKNYNDFGISFEKNLEIVNSVLNIQNYYIEKYDLKTLKKENDKSN